MNSTKGSKAQNKTERTTQGARGGEVTYSEQQCVAHVLLPSLGYTLAPKWAMDPGRSVVQTSETNN